MKLADMDAGKSLRILMAKEGVSREQLANDLETSLQTISTLRKNELISGKNLVIISNYFGVSPSDFIRLGETVKEGSKNG